MAKNYVGETPVGANGVPFLGADAPAPYKAIAQYLDENGLASSVISLTQNTTAIEIATQGTPAVMRWVPVTETAAVSPFASIIAIAGATANFDHVIPANTVRRFVVPIETGVNTTFGATITSVQGQNREYGLFQRVAYATQGVASVALTEYSKSNSY